MILVGSYGTLGTWMWLAWYDDQPTRAKWKFGGDGWFGRDSYAGGADQLGHVWANLALSRLGTKLLRAGGWNRWSSSLFASGLCLGVFLLVEVNDGSYTEFSPGDMTANGLGALSAVVMSNWPALDDAIDFRVQWFPSGEFRRRPSANFAEDYSGQTYLLAFKPRSIAGLRESEGLLAWLQFVNPVLGFESRNYKPEPPPEATAARQQKLYLRLTLDVQAMADAAFGDRASVAARWSYPVGHAIFEVINLPFTTLPLVSRAACSLRATPTLRSSP